MSEVEDIVSWLTRLPASLEGLDDESFDPVVRFLTTEGAERLGAWPVAQLLNKLCGLELYMDPVEGCLLLADALSVLRSCPTTGQSDPQLLFKVYLLKRSVP